MPSRKIASLLPVLVLIAAFFAASITFAQACGIPGGPACTPTPRPRPTTVPTQAPAVEQPAQPTAEPTATTAPTEVPLLPMPADGQCIAAANGNFRVNVRDIPSTGGEVVAVLSPTDVVQVLGWFTNAGGEDWVLALPGYILKAALRFGGEDCADVPVLETSDSYIVQMDFALIAAPDGTPGIYNDILGRGTSQGAGLVRGLYQQTLKRNPPPVDGASDDDVCIEYPTVNAWGDRGGTICLALDITSPTAVCVKLSVGEHCLLVLPEGEEAEDEPLDLAAALFPPDETPLNPVFPTVLKAIDLPSTEGNVHHIPDNSGDICIEHGVINPWGNRETLCLAADVSGGDIICIAKHCMVVVD